MSNKQKQAVDENGVYSARIEFVFAVRDHKVKEPNSVFGVLGNYLNSEEINNNGKSGKIHLPKSRDWGWMTVIEKPLEEITLETLREEITKPLRLECKNKKHATSFENGQPAQPFVLIHINTGYDKINGLVNDVALRAVAERWLKKPKEDGKKELKQWVKQHNHALTESWYCLLTGRALVTITINGMNQSSLVENVQQAVSFVWAETAQINKINQQIDDLLISNDILKPTSSFATKTPAERSNDLKKLIGNIVKYRRDYLFTLFDPCLYAFPAGTVHQVIAEARRLFRTEEARNQLLHKFETLDRFLDDTLQLIALGS